MTLSSHIYRCRIMHQRMVRYPNRFQYNTFLLYLDLDDLENLAKKLWLFSINKPNLFSFYEKDHSSIIDSKKELHFPKVSQNIRNRLDLLLKKNKISFLLGSVKILTQPRLFGFYYNPASFYFCYDTQNKLQAVVAEASNFNRKQKAYVIPLDQLKSKKKIEYKESKLFHLSPYIKYDTDIYFQLREPSEWLRLYVDSRKKQRIILKARAFGKKEKLSNRKLFCLAIRFPFDALGIFLFTIFHGNKLRFKKVPLYSKKLVQEKLEEIKKANKHL